MRTMSERATILVVEDDDLLAEMVVEHLQSTVDAEVLRTRNASDTIRLDAGRPLDLMLTDVLLPDCGGLDLIRSIRSRREYPVLIMTGKPTVGRAVEAMRLGVGDLFTKPFDLQRLTRVVKESLAKYHTLKRRQRRMERLEKLARKVIRERKELQQRVDLVCRDLVGSYRNLAERFLRHRNLTSESED